jgi:DNA polymerase-3 subunit gamma/tau
MSYQVIARKWRPQTFAEVTGQEPITRTLINALEHDRLHHAYLFSGARGVGKTTTARLLAKALNCHKATGPSATPCVADDPEACPSCREIAESRSMDVLEIDAASNTGVDNVRDVIISGIGIAPARDRYKVFIIDEVHMLTPQSFNALLKTLEEPPPNVVFIMATTEAHKLPDTILSRIQQFEFRTIASAKIADRLRLIAEAEKISIDEPALKEIARAGEGSMRDAQSAFDQVISFSGNKIGIDDVSTALGLAGTEMLDRVVRGIAEQDPAAALGVIDDLVMRGHDLRNFCRDLLGHFRDLLVAKVAGDNPALLESSIFEPAKLKEQAGAFSESDLIRFFHALAQTESGLRTAAHPRFQLEIGLVKLMEMRRVADLASIIERLAALENSTGGGSPAPTSSKPSGGNAPGSTSSSGTRGSTPPPVRATGRSAVTGSAADAIARSAQQPASGSTSAIATKPSIDLPFSGVDGSSPSNAVAEVVNPAPELATSVNANGSAAAPARSSSPELERIKKFLETKKKHLLVTALENAQEFTIGQDELIIGFSPDALESRRSAGSASHQAILREACQEVLGRVPTISIITLEPEEGAPLSRRQEEAREQQQLRDEAAQDPGVQRVLQVFHGEIIDVRRISQ